MAPLVLRVIAIGSLLVGLPLLYFGWRNDNTVLMVVGGVIASDALIIPMVLANLKR